MPSSSEVISTMPGTTEFSPAIPWREPFDVQTRIQELRGYLDPKNPQYERKEQHANIKAVIQLYKDGKIDGEQRVYIMEGKVVTKQEMFQGTAWAWAEGMCYQFAEKFAYDHGSLNPGFHEIRMLLRLTPNRGGDGTTYSITVMNDTGSSILSLFNADILRLGSRQHYTGALGSIAVRNANGAVNLYPQIHVQVQLVRDDDSPWSGWIDEEAIIKPSSPNVPRLSGLGMRGALYLGTAPGNQRLAAATTRGGMTSLL